MSKVLHELPRFVSTHTPPPRKYHVRAHVNFFQRLIELESWATYHSSHWDSKGLHLHLDPAASDIELGEAAWAVLRAARFVPPDHPDWSMFDRSWTPEEDRAYHAGLMARAGVKSRKALYAGAVSVSMEREDGVITLSTSVAHGNNGFRGVGLADVVLPDTVGPEALAQALRAAVARV